ncbi:hypothetical protein OHS81_00170 [Streptomyces sp. NBC_00400]|uniref:hypothetical protein n=1 Tax=Streptomyces sp. NBC_00400 TaxID=2975737 RepID=UPI002E1F08B0
MGSSFFVSADQPNGAFWPFSTGQLVGTITRLWPGSAVGDGRDGVLEMDIPLDDRTLAFDWDIAHQVLRFPDQDPLAEPARLVHRLLREVAPDVPAVWWTEDDATLEPIDLSPDPGIFIRGFVG